MDVEVIVALIGSLCTLLGVIITSYVGNKKQSKERQDNTNLTLYRIGQLETKQDKYNHLQERMATMEGWKKEVNRELETIRQHIVKK